MIDTQNLVEKKITIGKDVISYYDNLTGTPTLFFIHGSFLNKDYWGAQLYHFSSQYRVIAPDLAGHGRSTAHREDFTIDSFAEDVATMINELELTNVILIGHSIGGDIMLKANEKNNSIIGLIGIDHFKNIGSTLPDKAIDQLMNDLRNNFVNTNIAFAKNSLLTEATDKPIAERVVHDFSSISPKVGVPMNEDFFHFTKKEEILLKKLNRKLYLVVANYQPINETNLKEFLKNNYSLQIIEGTSHFPMLENPEALNKGIESFIQAILSEEAA